MILLLSLSSPIKYKYQAVGLIVPLLFFKKNDFGISNNSRRLLRSGLVLWNINHCMLLNAKYSLFIYSNYIGFGLVGFYIISTLIGYLVPSYVYTYILNIYDLVWFVFMAYQSLKSKSYLYI